MSGIGEGGRGTAPPQNVKPKPNPPPQNRRAAKARRSRSSDSEWADRSSRRRERDRHHGDRRGRSQETRRRNGKEVERVQNRPVDVVEDTECAVCFCSYDNVFKTPKLLACGHTFCLECLARINVSSAEIKSLTCPVCRLPTELRKGRDLPRLGTNQDIIGKLPADMRRALSVRFKRSKGKLMLKHPPPGSKPPALPLNKPRSPAEPDAAEPGAPPAAVVDVGRPPNRMRGRVRRLFRSDQCFYVVVASIITITVALMLVGILAFVIIPNVALYHGPAHPGNSTSPPGGGP